ncbi:hypothetical protein QJS04_geneDACA015272 [Acorus gramineus]|uniref:Uncharacterized protein n=1 Tax=Acorus gramineus TaxID=55184 RepID=A0AAV9APM9_ACOGR|nr:hypothetical protein QJS04_geneDACA015272 [Acorus gramineus]
MSRGPFCTVYTGNLDKKVTERVLSKILVQAKFRSYSVWAEEKLLSEIQNLVNIESLLVVLQEELVLKLSRILVDPSSRSLGNLATFGLLKEERGKGGGLVKIFSSKTISKDVIE